MNSVGNASPHVICLEKYYLLVIFCTETDGVIIISSDSEEDPDGPQTDESFFFPGDSRQHAANVIDDDACQRDPGAAAGDAEKRQPHDLDFAEGRVFQLRYVYCLSLDLRAQQTLKEILQGR